MRKTYRDLWVPIVFRLGRCFLACAPTGRFPQWNRFALRLMGVEVGAQTKIYSSIRIARGLNLTIGKGTFIGGHSVFTGGVGSRISIGDSCDVSDSVNFVTGTHEIDGAGERTAGRGYSMDIVVGNGVWIGYGALILPGVTIGDKAVIGAGTVVHRDVQARAVVAGSPMKEIRHL